MDQNATLPAVTSAAIATATQPNCAVRTAGCRKPGAPLCPHLRQPERADPAGANGLGDLGEDFGHGLYEAELRYLTDKEWVVELDDAIWRRTKLGMWLDEAQQARVKARWRNTRKRKRCLWLPEPQRNEKGRLSGPFLPFAVHVANLTKGASRTPRFHQTTASPVPAAH